MVHCYVWHLQRACALLKGIYTICELPYVPTAILANPETRSTVAYASLPFTRTTLPRYLGEHTIGA